MMHKHGFMTGRTLVGGLLLMAATMLAGVDAANARPNFTGKWQVADPDFVIRPDVNATEADYTPEAWADLQDSRKNWNQEVDDPAKFCVRYGMPHTMTTRARDYIIDINQISSRITVLLEYMDSYRVIHLGKSVVPDSVAPSNNGYSIAHWEGDTLVIETTMLKARNPVGPVQRSDQAHITERWTLGKESPFGKVLNIDMIIDDPKVFRHPVKARQKYKAAPAGAELNEYGCVDAMWDDYVARKRAERAGQAQGAPAH